jgi:hypothetical protein
VDVDAGAWAVGAVVAGALLEEAFFVPVPALVPVAEPALVVLPLAEPDVAVLPLVERDRVDPVPAVAGLADAEVRFAADDGDFVVGFSALMEQRYAVFPARRESDPGPRRPDTGSRRGGSGPDSAARR